MKQTHNLFNVYNIICTVIAHELELLKMCYIHIILNLH